MIGKAAQGSAMTLNKKLTKSEFRQRADKILMRLSLEVMDRFIEFYEAG